MHQTLLETKIDIEWACAVHATSIDPKPYRFAILYGNEDCPTQIEFWYARNPHYLQQPDATWEAEKA